MTSRQLGTVYYEVCAERNRAAAKHKTTGMDGLAPSDPMRIPVLVEEVGEVAREFNDANHERRLLDMGKLRKELVQVAAMAVAWAEAIRTGREALEPNDDTIVAFIHDEDIRRLGLKLAWLRQEKARVEASLAPLLSAAHHAGRSLSGLGREGGISHPYVAHLIDTAADDDVDDIGSRRTPPVPSTSEEEAQCQHMRRKEDV